jgi:hypothetical protein
MYRIMYLKVPYRTYDDVKYKHLLSTKSFLIHIPIATLLQCIRSAVTVSLGEAVLENYFVLTGNRSVGTLGGTQDAET